MAIAQIKYETELPSTFLDRLEIQRGQRKCDLSLCQVKKVPVSAINKHFGKPRNMEMDLSFNFISYLSPDFALALKHLVKLDLSRNEIKKLPDNFGELDKLVLLDLHKNQLGSLPLSIGNLKRLTYLNIRDNPLRSPLREMMDRIGPDISGLSTAEMMIPFLQGVAEDLYVIPQHASMFPVRSRPTRIRRSSSSRSSRTTEVDLSSDTESSLDELKPEFREPSVFQRFTFSIGRTIVVGAITCIMGPILIAYIADTSYLQHLSENYPTFDMFWTGYNYKEVHELALPVAELFPRNSAWMLKGPDMDAGMRGFLKRTWGLIYKAWMTTWTPFFYVMSALEGMGSVVGITQLNHNI